MEIEAIVRQVCTCHLITEVVFLFRWSIQNTFKRSICLHLFTGDLTSLPLLSHPLVRFSLFFPVNFTHRYRLILNETHFIIAKEWWNLSFSKPLFGEYFLILSTCWTHSKGTTCVTQLLWMLLGENQEIFQCSHVFHFLLLPVSAVIEEALRHGRSADFS